MNRMGVLYSCPIETPLAVCWPNMNCQLAEYWSTFVRSHRRFDCTNHMATTSMAQCASDIRVRRFSSIRALYGSASYERLAHARLLVIGAGGIGCELLKALALAGACTMHVIDLDEVDVSNLNRQFLFRKKHVGRSKALAAAQTIQQFNSHVQVKAEKADIRNAKFGQKFFQNFDVVLNALDNIDARRHVNRMCVATKRPLIESGTQGYSGQATTILPGKSACYECNKIQTPKTFAVCTIRHTPDKPVHCIVWAKWVFSALFGPEDAENAMSDVRSRFCIDSDRAAEQLFTELFETEIKRQLEISDRWVNRKPPVPLNLESLTAVITEQEKQSVSSHHSVPTAAATAWFLIQSLRRLFSEHANMVGQLEFDKDNELAIDIVTALANLRMANFQIPLQSRFSVKGIAGNIVHAIATTNAITAGLMVSETMKVLNAELDSCKTIWIRRTAKAITPEALALPNKECYVCNMDNTFILSVNTFTFTTGSLLSKVLKSRLGLNEPSIDVTNRDNFIGTVDDQDGDFWSKKLHAPGSNINDEAELTVADESQSITIKIRVCHDETLNEEEHPEGFHLISVSGNEAAVVMQQKSKVDSSFMETTVPDEDDDLTELDDEGAALPRKRKLPRTAEQITQKLARINTDITEVL